MEGKLDDEIEDKNMSNSLKNNHTNPNLRFLRKIEAKIRLYRVRNHTVRENRNKRGTIKLN